MSSPELQFEEAGHVYRLDGRVLPSVTQVLRFLDDFESVPPAVLEAARQFGTHVHTACHLDVLGTLDEDALDPALAPYVEAFRKFRAESGFEILSSEERVYHVGLNYAGTLDLRAAKTKHTARGASRRLALIDIKSGVVPRSVGAQTAAYNAAWSSRNGGEMHDRYCLQLRGDATYKLHPLTDATDFSMFVSCLNLHNWKERHAA